MNIFPQFQSYLVIHLLIVLLINATAAIKGGALSEDIFFLLTLSPKTGEQIHTPAPLAEARLITLVHKGSLMSPSPSVGMAHTHSFTP